MTSPPPPTRPVGRLLIRDAVRAAIGRVEGENEESPEDRAFETKLDGERIKHELDKLGLANENEKQLIALRKAYGRNMVRFLWAYFAVTMALIVLDSFFIAFNMPEGVAVALVGGTAVSVLGVVGTIVAGLFRVKGE